MVVQLMTLRCGAENDRPPRRATHPHSRTSPDAHSRRHDQVSSSSTPNFPVRANLRSQSQRERVGAVQASARHFVEQPADIGVVRVGKEKTVAEEGGCDASDLVGLGVDGLRVAEAAAEDGGKVAGGRLEKKNRRFGPRADVGRKGRKDAIMNLRVLRPNPIRVRSPTSPFHFAFPFSFSLPLPIQSC